MLSAMNGLPTNLLQLAGSNRVYGEVNYVPPAIGDYYDSITYDLQFTLRWL